MKQPARSSFSQHVGEDAPSPGLCGKTEAGPAFELKYQLDELDARNVEAWARRHLIPDPNGDRGIYLITSVYCDTPDLDVFHRSSGYRRSKYRARRYGVSSRIHLERKKRWGDRVRKTRVEVDEDELALLTQPAPPADWPGLWFHERVHERGLRPTCRVGYRRSAFVGRSGDAAVRLTLDADVTGSPANDWDLTPPIGGKSLMPGVVLLEMKFHAVVPELFRGMLADLPAQQGRVSKYRRCIRECRLT